MKVGVLFFFYLFRIVSEEVELFVGVAPVLIHLHESLQINRLAEESLQTLPCLRSHLLQSLTLMTYDNTLLAVALDVDYGIDVNMGIILLETLNADFY